MQRVAAKEQLFHETHEEKGCRPHHQPSQSTPRAGIEDLGRPAGVGGIGGYAPDVEIQARELIRQQTKVRQIMATHTGQTMEKIAHDFDRDNYMDAQQAVEYGIIDEVMPTAADIPGNEPSRNNAADSLIAGALKV